MEARLFRADVFWSRGQVIGEARDGPQAVQITNELRPDIVLLDIQMPVLNGIEAARRIRQASPTSKIIFLSLDNDADIRTEALATGAAYFYSELAAALRSRAGSAIALNEACGTTTSGRCRRQCRERVI